MNSIPARQAHALPESRIADRYTLERLLGQGGMGAVYAALDEATGKRVALKRLLGDANAKASALFEREYQTLSSLHHPAIVEVYDYGRDAAGAYYTMEVIEGADLSKQAPLPWREVCACMRDVAAILGLLHARKLVHRDLSPRNLLRTPAGRLKLIDFGALASFGPSKETVGTPPFVPPEAIAPAVLDQRSDLFALGALGYWLVTGTHAFPARSLKDLPRLWERTPASPASLVALLADSKLSPVPPALDELLLSLLRIAPAERPRDTTELIDRLSAIADLEPESQDSAIEGYLKSQVLVARERERERVATALAQVQTGHGQALLLEGEPGVGRTRFLTETEVMAQLAGLVTLRTDAAESDKPYAAAIALCLQALNVIPDQTRKALTSFAPVLGRLSSTLHQRLGGGALAPSSETPGEDRVRAQSALRELFVALSAPRPLALLLDDLHAIDEESQGLFAALAHSVEGHPLLLIATAKRDGSQALSAAMQSYRARATRLHLLPLSSTETLELLHSVFGSVAYLERLAERLHRISEGSPAHCLELAEHLVRIGAARYQEGAWALPAELSEDSLPSSRRAGYLARVERVSREAHRYARHLSVPHDGPLTLEDCQALAKFAPHGVAHTLDELVREGLLHESAESYRFAHAELQSQLCAELTPSERALSHRLLGTSLAARANDSQLALLRAALHFLRADLPERAYPLVLAASRGMTGAGLNSALRVSAPLFEQIYQLIEARGDDLYARSEPLSVLALAGYFIDRRYAERYGDRAVETLSKLLKLKMARVLTRFLGRKAALIITLIVAGVGLRLRKRRGPTLPFAIKRLLSVCSALAGTAACCIDPKRCLELASVIEPFTVLGDDHAASIVHRFTMALARTVQDRMGATRAELRSLIERLESPTPIRALDDAIRLNYLAGSYFCLGTNEARRESDDVLKLADRLEQFSPLYALSADRLRQIYYYNQGQTARSESYRQRVELHAVQLGSAWQVETWEPVHVTERALRTCDAMIMKRGVQELSRLASEIPSLAPEERYAHGTYLMLRGKFAESLPLLETDSEPLSVLGWTRVNGSLARSYNGLGQHARARKLCVDTLEKLTPEDLLYPVMNLPIQLQLALADAGLADFAAARLRLDELLTKFADGTSPITRGLIHEAYVRVTLKQGDLETARAELTALASCWRPLDIASLLQQLAALTRELDRAEHPHEAAASATGTGPRLLDDVAHLMTRVQLVLSRHSSTQLEERVNRGLQIALELSSADEGFVMLQDERGSSEIHLGSAPSAELSKWARQQLRAASVDDQTVMTEEDNSEVDSNYLVIGRMRYCAATLIARRGNQDLVVGTLVLGFDGRVPKLPPHEVLTVIAESLAD